MALIGADALHQRLNALLGVPGRVQETWAIATVPIMRSDIPVRTGATRSSLAASRSGIVGSPVVNFLDSGTRAHDEVAHGQTLKFQKGGQTLFRKRVHKPQTRGQHFKEAAARRGLDEVGNGVIVKTWNNAA